MNLKDSPELVFTLPPQPLQIDRNTKVKVYGSTLPLTRDKRVVWMLNELGIPYEFVAMDVFKGEHLQPDYLRIHASGLVPAIQVGEFYMVESVAIMMLLADRFPESGLAPAPDDLERPAYLQWMLYGGSNLEAIVAKLLHVVPKGAHPDASQLQYQLPVFDRYVIMLEKMLEKRDYLLLRGFSAADISVAWTLFGANYVGLLEQYPILKRYFDRLAERPAFQASFTGDDYYQRVERAKVERAAKQIADAPGA